jgi:hypothetical protein
VEDYDLAGADAVADAYQNVAVRHQMGFMELVTLLQR